MVRGHKTSCIYCSSDWGNKSYQIVCEQMKGNHRELIIQEYHPWPSQHLVYFGDISDDGRVIIQKQK